MSPYRHNAKPPEEPVRKKSFFCRIGFHLWGAASIREGTVLYCLRCDTHYIGNLYDLFLSYRPSRRLKALRTEDPTCSWSCGGTVTNGRCKRMAVISVHFDTGELLFLCATCAARAVQSLSESPP